MTVISLAKQLTGKAQSGESPNSSNSTESLSSSQPVSKRPSKRGRPKSERKGLDSDLFQQLKKTKEAAHSEVKRLQFQKDKLEKFRNGMPFSLNMSFISFTLFYKNVLFLGEDCMFNQF